ncbi:MAG: CDP-glycerol glycerophosphotransferase family protein [Chloracidobacterium sp.]|nr:CDP-glycerol glycerophosphotransferase family protein [Chloracidobacterium sp.]
MIDILNKAGNVSIWATSYDESAVESCWADVDADIQKFPQVRAFREIPHNFLRRLNEFVWDYRYLPPSRMSMMEHIRNKRSPLPIRALKPPARLLALLKTERRVESGLEKLLLAYPRSDEAETRLRENRPDVVVSTGPFQFEQPAIFTAAKKLRIPTLAYIPSWDNISTKNRMVFKYDGYIVWNEQAKRELYEFYPETKDCPVYVIGAPQFDIFHQERFRSTREEFCKQQDLDPDLPIVVYAVGSPNFLQEKHGAEYLAKRVANGDLGDVQLLVRPHPIHDNAEMKELFDPYLPKVRLQETPNTGKELNKRTQDELQIVEWVNTFRHADVVVNLSSTVTIDAAIFDRPVVNLDFDPQPGQADQQLIKDVNHKWNHFKPIAESGGVWLINDFNEMVDAVRGYLKQPELHREKRRWIAEYVCGYLDGKNSERMANAIVEFVASRERSKN